MNKYIALLLVLLFLVACGDTIDPEQELPSVGGSSPESVAESFFEDLNDALKDANLSTPAVRLRWSDRLASYFAPSERIDQRAAFSVGLWTFDNLADQIADDQRLTVEIQYGGIELVERTSDHARIRLVDGAVTLRQVRIAESGYEEVLRQQQRPLTEVLGEDYSVLPVLRVNDRWFLTEINPLPVPETPS